MADVPVDTALAEEAYALQSAIRSFIYGMWGHAGDARVRPALDALDRLAALASVPTRSPDACEHEWVSADNVCLGSVICVRCRTLTAADPRVADAVAKNLARSPDRLTEALRTIARCPEPLGPRESSAAAQCDYLKGIARAALAAGLPANETTNEGEPV